MRSMTGFGRAESRLQAHAYTFECRAVNHRFLDVRVRLPQALASLEQSFSDIVRASAERGSFDITLSRRSASLNNPTALGETGSGTRFSLDKQAADSFRAQVELLQTSWGTPLPITVEALVAAGRIILTIDENLQPAELEAPLSDLLKTALQNLIEMRDREGEKTLLTLEKRTNELSHLVDQIERLSLLHPKQARERLLKRLEQLKPDIQLNPERLEVEAALIADRADISEEVERLKNHLQEFSKLLRSHGSLGRKLDFLTQELHRETNTIASKSASHDLSKLTVECRTTIEKLREQVQNVE